MRETFLTDVCSGSLAATRGAAAAAATAHLQPGEKADIHKGVDELQVLVDVERRDESCSRRRRKLLDVADRQKRLEPSLSIYFLSSLVFFPPPNLNLDQENK